MYGTVALRTPIPTFLDRRATVLQLGKSLTLLLSETASSVCPVNALSNFFRVRNPNTPQPQDSQLLIHFNGNSLTCYQFSAILATCLRFSNVLNGGFRSHYFGIGAATEAAMRGVPDDVIKQWGRWKSGAYASYVRFA